MKPENVPTPDFIRQLIALNPKAHAALEKCPAFKRLFRTLDMDQMCDLFNLYEDLIENRKKRQRF